jgi:ribonucleoside-triphosphate reductase
LLPLLAGDGSAPYFYERNACYNLSFVGLNEAVNAHASVRMDRDKGGMEFALKVLQELAKIAKTASEEFEMRITVSQRPGDEAVGRLAELDIEQFGRAGIVADGSRGAFGYTDMPAIPLASKLPIDMRLASEAKLQAALPGGHLNLLCVAANSVNGPALMNVTKSAMESGNRFITYTCNYSACEACTHTDAGIMPKCSKCGSDKLTYLGRSSYGLLPFSLWPEAKRRSVEKRVEYSITPAMQSQ